MIKSNMMEAIKQQVSTLLQDRTIYDLAALTGHSYSTTWRQVVGKTSLKMDFIIALEQAGLIDFSGLNVVYEDRVKFTNEETATLMKALNVLQNIGIEGLSGIKAKVEQLAEVSHELY